MSLPHQSPVLTHSSEKQRHSFPRQHYTLWILLPAWFIQCLCYAAGFSLAVIVWQRGGRQDSYCSLDAALSNRADRYSVLASAGAILFLATAVTFVEFRFYRNNGLMPHRLCLVEAVKLLILLLLVSYEAFSMDAAIHMFLIRTDHETGKVVVISHLALAFIDITSAAMSVKPAYCPLRADLDRSSCMILIAYGANKHCRYSPNRDHDIEMAAKQHGTSTPADAPSTTLAVV